MSNSGTTSSATIVFSANTSWYLYNHHRNTLRTFAEAGYTVHIVSPDDDHAKKLMALGYRHTVLPIRSASTHPLRELQAFVGFLRAYRKVKPDAAFHYTIKCNLYGSLAANLLGIPSVSSVSGLGRAFDFKGVARWVIHLAYKWTQRQTHRMVFQSTSDRDYMIDAGIVTPAKCVVVGGSGVDLALFQPRAARPGKPFTFVFAGRVLWEKGFPWLPQAMEILQQENPDARCLVYGFLDAVDGQYVPRNQLAEWEKQGFVEYRGPVENIADAYAEADCVILPTDYREGIPKSLLEAAAMSLPLIASNKPGCLEIVRPGETGLVCPPRDPRALADVMSAMIGLGDEERAAMGRKARALVEHRFDQRSIAATYLEVAASMPIR